MLLEFIAMVAAAFGAAGIVLLLNRITGRRLPKWLMPVAVAAAMMSFAVWSEYSWYDRVSSQLDPGVAVVDQDSRGAPWRPWSYFVPVTDSFLAVDLGRAVPHAVTEGQRFLNTYRFARWTQPQVATVLIDCRQARGIALEPGADFPVEAIPPENAWRPIPGDDPVLTAACAEV
jgi:hypothetical protein